jgi:peptidoglycan/xylan/chitin deacetylase (PgdA/CDA1 family)
MKKLFFIWLFFLICFSFAKSQQNANYEIATWYGFKNAAVTYTFDDLSSNQLPVALPIFDRYNYKITFYPIISWNPDWLKLTEVVRNGHEVGSHTFTHPDLANLTDTVKLNYEILGSQEFIDSTICIKQCVSIAYPYCAVNQQVKNIVKNKYIGARICSGVVELKTPADYMAISSIVCGTMGLNSVDALNQKVNEAVAKNGWCVFLLHGVNDDSGYSPVTDSLLNAHLSYVSSRPDDYWVATLSEVIKYIKERDAVQVKELSVSNSRLMVIIDDTLSDSIYNKTLSVKRLLPKGWKSAFVYQNDKQLKSNTKLIDNKKYVVFDATPSSQKIIISKNRQKIKI